MSYPEYPKEFLDKFTEEMILNLKMKQEESKNIRINQDRIDHEIEKEKIKMKFVNNSPRPVKEISKPLLAQPQRIIPAPSPPQSKPVISKPIEKPKLQEKKEMPITIIPMPPASQMPVPKSGEANFGKILYLIRDPNLSYIECPGENKNIIIKRPGQTIRTQITLKKEEILAIIGSISDTARIPLIEGMLIARLSNLEISAVVSEDSDSSFIIKKTPILPPPSLGFNRPSGLQRSNSPLPNLPPRQNSNQINKPNIPQKPIQPNSPLY